MMTLTIAGDKQTTLNVSTDQWITLAKEAIEEKGAFFVALSGGSTPKAIFEKLHSRKNEVSWEHVWLFWSDERAVKPTDSDSNYNMAMGAGLKNVGIPERQIIRMEGETLDAAGYEEKIKTLVPDASFDLIMLGMGDDGHTASLFPGTSALKETNHFVVVNHVPQKKCDRLTFTYPLIEKAKNVIIYVIGEGKAKMIAKVLEEQKPFPVSEVKAKEVEWVLDQAAASELRSQSVN